MGSHRHTSYNSFQGVWGLQLQHRHWKVHTPVWTNQPQAHQKWQLLVWKFDLQWPHRHSGLGHTGGGLRCYSYEQHEYCLWFEFSITDKSIGQAAPACHHHQYNPSACCIDQGIHERTTDGGAFISSLLYKNSVILLIHWFMNQNIKYCHLFQR